MALLGGSAGRNLEIHTKEKGGSARYIRWRIELTRNPTETA